MTENHPEDSSSKRSILDLAGLLAPPNGVRVSIEDMNPFRDRPTPDDVPALIRELYAIVAKLEAIFPGRHFTPDGHLVGSLGEALASHYYGVVLCKASNEGYDGLREGKRVEVKVTQGGQVPLSCSPEHLLVFRLLPDGTFEECFNGPGSLAWQLVAHRKPAKRGQHLVTLSALRRVMTIRVRPGQTLEPSRPLPEGTTRALPGTQAQ
jgi:hypothetical protein